MSQPCCPATTRTGRPCAARPLPGRDCCLFHDPARQPALTDSRRQGGAAPRRRTRRYPLLLDYKHVAELLSDLFVEALNDPAAADPQRLRALTGLARVLLQAVGRPKGTYEIHKDRSEPPPEEQHLLRVYSPEPPALTRLRATDVQIEAQLEADLAALPPPAPPAPSHPSDPSDPPGPSDRSDRSDPSDHLPDPEHLNTRTPEHPTPPLWPQDPEQDDEQDRNRAGTGTPATDQILPATLVRSPAEDDPQQETNPDHPTEPAPPTAATPPPPIPDSVSPWLRVEETATTLSVPGIPILISYRRIPGPFE